MGHKGINSNYIRKNFMNWNNYQYVVTYYYGVQNKKEDRKHSYLSYDYEVWNFINMKKPTQNQRNKEEFYSRLWGNRIRTPEVTTCKKEDSNVCSVSVWIVKWENESVETGTYLRNLCHAITRYYIGIY